MDLDRRRLLTVLAVGTAAAVSGCARPVAQVLTDGPVPHPAPGSPVVAPLRPRPVVPAQAVVVTEAPVTSPSEVVTSSPLLEGPEVIHRLPVGSLPSAVALTIDDGFNPEVVAAYVAFAQATGVHLTFNPNGLYSYAWDLHAPVLRPLIEAGQVQIGNHTYDHKNLKRLSDRKVVEQVERNDAWVQQVFGVTTRPWLRPPFGFHDERTDALAAEIGYTKVLMWDGSFGDAAVLTPAVLMAQARLWLKPGAVVLGHANHPAITRCFWDLVALMTERGLVPQTLDEAFGTSRS